MERTVRVSGMTCEHCERRITAELEQIDGVTASRADAAAGTVVVTSDTVVADDDLRDAIEEAGYELVG